MRTKRYSAISILFFAAAFIAAAQEPLSHEEFIYTVEAFNGTKFSATFIREESDTMYLLSDIDNFVWPRKSMLYFWPLSNQWLVDSDLLFETLKGFLEVSGPGIQTKKLGFQDFTYYNQAGEYEVNWKVLTDDAAAAEVENFNRKYTELQNAMEDYNMQYQFYRKLKDARLINIKKEREAGHDIQKLLAEVEAMKPPVKPEPLEYFVYPLRKAFVLNLKEGEYLIRFVNADGNVMENSEKKVVVFNKRRSEGIGYEIFPEDKWTIPDKSQTPSSVLYVNGTTNLYIKPFFQDEFNDLYYNRLVINDSKGNANIYRWEEIQQVPNAEFDVKSGDGSTEKIPEKEYVVEQIKTRGFGYKIVPYDPEKHLDRNPDLKAFLVPIDRNSKSIGFMLRDEKGDEYPFSEREIRVVRKSPLNLIIFIYALLPLLAMVIIIAMRLQFYRKHDKGDH
ncbi:MAG: hypothetical protein JW969_16445 [Spirochaetales bacterium]|nr:hypothetical protein [Spirochaetales bacterium]